MVPSVILATTDTSPANALIPVVELFLQQGDVVIYTRGASKAIWEKWKENHISKSGSISIINPDAEISFQDKPAWLITGASSNSTFEHNKLDWARKNGIPTAVYVDIDGAHRRFDGDIGYVDVFLVEAESVKAEILKDYPEATVVVVGTPSAKVTKPNEETALAIQKCGFTKTKTVTWAAGGTLSDLELVVESLLRWMREHALIMGLHPDPTKVAGIDDILKLTRPLREQGRLLWDPQDPNSSLNIPSNTVQKGLASLLTVGASSSVLDEIAYNGGDVCSVVNLETLTSFAKVCPGVNMFPGVSAGRAAPVCRPSNLEQLYFAPTNFVRGTMKIYDPRAIVEALGY